MLVRSLATLLAGVILVPALASSQPPKAKHPPSAARPHLPGHRIYLTHRHGWHRVDYRVTAWQVVPAANHQAAQQIARMYRSRGWSATVQQPVKGRFVVRAKLSRWQLATYAAHLRTAESVAGLLRSQGYQARVRY